MLTARVPKGNDRAARRATARSTRNRSTAPMPPASTTPSQIISAAPPDLFGSHCPVDRRRRSSAHRHPTNQSRGEIHRKEPENDAGAGVFSRQNVVVMLDHLQRLDLHGREGGQTAAQPGSKQGPAVTRQRQSLQQPRREITHQEGTD